MECEACLRSSEMQSQCRYCRRYVCPEHAQPSSHECRAFELLHPALDLKRLAKFQSRRHTMKIAAASLAFMVAGLIIFSPLALANYIPPSASVTASSIIDQASQQVSNFMESMNRYVAPMSIDHGWVDDFISLVNEHRTTTAHLTYCPALQSFAKVRYAQMTGGTNWQLSRFGFDRDNQNYFGSGSAVKEDVLYPAGFSTRAYYDALLASFPAKYWVLDPNYVAYSYYIGTAPTVKLQGACLAPTPGANVNMTQYYFDNGCSSTKLNTVWVVLELAPVCPTR